MITKTLAFLMLLCLPTLAQVEMQQSYSYAGPHFYFDALSFKGVQDKSRLDFYFQIPYNELQFIKHGDRFEGSYEISLKLSDKDGNPVLEQAWNERPSCQTFDETENRSIFSSSERQFVVQPGIYTLQVTVADSETQKSFVAKRPFEARNYSDSSEGISDIMLLKGSSFSGGKKTIVPNISGNVISQNDSFPIFYEVYFPKTNDSTCATTEIFNAKKELVYSDSSWIAGPDKTKRVIAEVPKDSIPMGIYRLSVVLRKSTDKETPVTATASHFFSIHFPDLPLSILNIDDAADEMLYIANSSTIDSIKSAHDAFTKEKRFLNFWQNYKTNSSSRGNTIMDEYFNRVAYANEHFTRYFKGWKTDMGMIYILFGPPNAVDRHPFEVDSKPYEVWDYYQRNHQFVFVDETGFGDYRLITPLSDVYSPPYGPDFIGR
jgi:GWxTD domain-containing protein